MPEHDKAFLRPEIEVAEPKLLVDLGDETVHFAQTVVRNAKIESASKMKGLKIVTPVQRDVIVRPVAADDKGQLVIASTIARPVVGRGNLLEEIDRIRDAT